jgi:hypothetical protein
MIVPAKSAAKITISPKQQTIIMGIISTNIKPTKMIPKSSPPESDLVLFGQQQ